jgi:peptidoglycan hydrolase FlgJ
MAALHALASPVMPAAVTASSARDASGGAAPDLKTPDLKAPDLNSKTHAAAVNFEAQFLNAMFSQMFAGLQGDGPFGGGPAIGVWRSFLSEQYAKSFAKAGGIGIADHVYHTLLAQQEAHVH